MKARGRKSACQRSEASSDAPVSGTPTSDRPTSVALAYDLVNRLMGLVQFVPRDQVVGVKAGELECLLLAVAAGADAPTQLEEPYPKRKESRHAGLKPQTQ